MTNEKLETRLGALEAKVDAIKSLLENVLALAGTPTHVDNMNEWTGTSPAFVPELTTGGTEPWHWDPERQQFFRGLES